MSGKLATSHEERRARLRLLDPGQLGEFALLRAHAFQQSRDISKNFEEKDALSPTPSKELLHNGIFHEFPY